MNQNTKSIARAIWLGSVLIAATVAITGRYQVAGGPEGPNGGTQVYIVRDAWTGSS